MRKHHFKLMGKKRERVHLKKGTSLVDLPLNTPLENYRYFKIFGNDGGVGDYNSRRYRYEIPIHIHGKNLMGGAEFFDIHYNLKVSQITGSVNSGFYTTTPIPEHNGTVIIGPNHVKFKKKTAYTLALQMKYFTSATRRHVGMRFDYSDGTYFFPVLETSSREFCVCLTSDPSKDLVSISSHADTADNMRIGLDGFGLYEGAYSDYDALHEAYCGQRATITLFDPIRKIDFAADDIDIITGTVTRKIKTIPINEECEVLETSRDGVYFIPFEAPMRPGGRAICDCGPIDGPYETGVQVLEDGSGLLYRPPSYITGAALTQNYLGEYSFEVSYILNSYEYSSIPPIEIASYTSDVCLEVLTNTEPIKTITEYV